MADNFFTRLLSPLSGSQITQLQESVATASHLSAINLGLETNVTDLRESIRDLSLHLEDLDWIPVDGWEEEKGFPIEVIKGTSDKLRALLTVNPTIKKAVNARVGYIWGSGVTFDGAPKAMLSNPHNQDIIFDDSAKWKLEAQLATDGNIWSARNKGTNEIIQVPIDQIGGWVVDENDPSRVKYWLRRYSVVTKNFATNIETSKYIEVFYPAYGLTGGTTPTIDGIKVDRSIEMVHIAANRQEGWILGVPDIMAAMFWAKGHKELFEAGTAYIKAQGKFASKVTSKTQAGAQRSAAAIAGAPRRDETTGEVLEFGGTAVMSAGLDMQLMGKMSGGVDFNTFDPVAGLIAVGMGVPLSVILGTSDGEEKSLEDSTVQEMKMRQSLWSKYFKALFDRNAAKVIWPKIKSEPTYRQIQSLEISNKSVALSREEIRLLTLEAYGIDGDPKALPDIEENAAYLMAKAIADNAAENAADAAQTAQETAVKVAAATPDAAQDTTPAQGVDAKIGKLSTGADAKASRNNKADTNTANK